MVPGVVQADVCVQKLNIIIPRKRVSKAAVHHVDVAR